MKSQTMRITIVEGEQVDDWKQSLEFVLSGADKSLSYGAAESRGTRYVRGDDACGQFMLRDLSIREYEVHDDTPVSELIAHHAGEPPRIYSRDDLAEVRFEMEMLGGRNLSREELLEVAERITGYMPSMYLINSEVSLWAMMPSAMIWNGRLCEAKVKVKDGDVLLARRISPANVLSTAWRSCQGPGSGRMISGAHEFFDAISSQPAKPDLNSRHPGRFFYRPGQIALLYTEDDADVATYVRTHYHELDIASGEHCNLYFVENPGVIAPVRYWRPLLGAKLHAAWKLLGWASSVPYDKAHVYQIAQRLGVRFDQLPCAVVFVPGSSEVVEVVTLNGHLPAILRGLLARFQEAPDPMQGVQRRSGRESEHDGESKRAGQGASGPVVFLGHASADKVLVRSVAVQLQSYGIEAWFNEWQIRPGDSLTREIEWGLARAEIVVLFLSRGSLASAWAELEMRAALHAHVEKRQYRTIIPVIVDDCEIPPLLRDYRPILGADPTHIVEELCAAVNDRASSLRAGHSLGNQRSPSPEIKPLSPRLPMKHTILFLAANPLGTDRLALDREAHAIQVELERSGFRDRFDLVTRWATEPLDLLREIRKLKPTVVHFSGHGNAEAADDHRLASVPHRDIVGEPSHNGSEPQHGLFLQGTDGYPQFVSARAIEETFGAAGSSVKVVVLNACYSDVQADALLAHVDCVIGMSGAIHDDAARSFAIGFYGGLGERESIMTAYKQGHAAICLKGQHDSGRPQLKIRPGVDAAKIVLASGPQ